MHFGKTAAGAQVCKFREELKALAVNSLLAIETDLKHICIKRRITDGTVTKRGKIFELKYLNKYVYQLFGSEKRCFQLAIAPANSGGEG